MAENTIEIKIGVLELRCRGEGDWPQQQLGFVIETIRDRLPELLPGVVEPEEELPTAVELLARSSARTFGEKAGVIAYWLQKYGGRSRWRSGEIVEVLRDMDEAAPTNITDALNQKLKKELFSVKDRMWQLTERGIGWVEFGLGLESSGAPA